MALVIADRVRETTTTTGTGSVTLAGAYTSFQTFSAAIGNANSTYYTIASATSGEWEVGIGTYSTSGNVLSRDTVLASSAGGAKVTFSAGTKDVFVTQPAERSLLVQSAGSGLFAGAAAFTNNGAVYANSTTTLTSGTLPTASGGTGLTSFTANGVVYASSSSVLTTGSALTFDGTTLTATTSASTAGNFKATSSTAQVINVTASNDVNTTVGLLVLGSAAGSLGMLGAGAPALYTAATELNLMANNASGVIKFAAGGTSEQMRLTSTGLGIGTSSPSQKLDVLGSIAVRAGTSGANQDVIALRALNSDNTAYANAIYYANSHRWAYAGATEGMRLDSSGNLGIGTNSPTVRLQVEGAANSAPLTLLRLNNSGTTAGGPGIASRISFTAGATSLGYIQGSNFASGAAGLQFSGDGTNVQATLDSSGNLGLGVTPSAWSAITAMQVKGAALGSTGNELYLYANAYYAAGTAWTYRNTAAAFGYEQNGGHKWYTAPSGTGGTAITSFTQAMTLDASGNLGVGTTSPGAKLQVGDAGSTAPVKILIRSASADTYLQSTSTGSVVGTPNGVPLIFNTNDAERARIDSSGNLGIGTNLPAARLSVEQSGLTTTTTVASIVTEATAIAPAILDFDHYTTVDSVGSAFLRFRKANGTKASPTVSTNRATGRVGSQIYDGAAFYDNCLMLFSADGAPTLNSTPGRIQFYTTPSGSTNVSERMRITNDGKIGIGQTSPQTALGFANTATISWGTTNYPFISGDQPNNTLTFGTQATERARIDSSGNLLVGTTLQPSGATSRQVVKYATADYVSYFWNTNATPYGVRIQHDTDVNGTGNEFLACIGNVTTRATIRSNGGIANYQANDVNLSDRREKTNFAPAKSYLDTICAIPVQTFNYIDQSEDDPGLTLGVVAQDVQAVAPELVMESNWGTKEDPKMRLSIYQTDLQYALMKCIQELKAEVDSLKAQLKGA